MMFALRGAAVLLFAASMMNGCAHGRASDPLGNLDTKRPVVLQIVNHNWSDINVSLVQGGRHSRLLTVTAASNASISIPYRNLGDAGEIQLEADPIGGTHVETTEVLFARPGAVISWTLESDLRRSSISIY